MRPSDVTFEPESDVVVQPYGSFISNKKANSFCILNRAATAIALSAALPLPTSLPYDAENVSTVLDALVKLHLLQKRNNDHISPSILENGEKVVKYIRADVEITNRCNLRCNYCYAEANNSKFELTKEEWIEILSSLISRGLRAAIFSGGEPFIREDFLDILDWAAPKLITEINTNGYYIDRYIGERLSKFSLKRIQVSLDSVIPQYHDSQRGKGSHRKALEALDILISFHIPTQISTVLTRGNEEEIPRLIAFAKDIGAEINITPVSRNGFARRIPDIEWEENFGIKQSYYSGEKMNALGVYPLCQSVVGNIAISFSGDLKPCNQREKFFSLTEKVSLSNRTTKWWESDFAGTQLGAALSEVPFDGESIYLKRENASPCALQEYLLRR